MFNVMDLVGLFSSIFNNHNQMDKMRLLFELKMSLELKWWSIKFQRLLLLKLMWVMLILILSAFQLILVNEWLLMVL